MSDFHGVPVPAGQGVGLIPINNEIDVYVGEVTTLITRPEGRTSIVFRVETGNIYIKPGKYADFESSDFDPSHFLAMPDDPSTTTYGTDDAGEAPWSLAEGAERAFLAPKYLSVKGDAATAKMRFYFF